MNLTYRLATHQDAEQLRTLGILAYGQFKDNLTPENWETMNVLLETGISYQELLDKSAAFVCQAQNSIIGMAYLIPNGNPTDIFQEDWCYIRMVGVNPAYGGNGIGKKLIQMCIEYAKEAQEKTIALHTSEFMDSARHIYEGLGFERIHEIAPRFGKKYWIYKLELNKPQIKMIQYQREKKISVEEFREVLVNSTLGERRPIDAPERLAQMLNHGNLIITARLNEKLIGISRALSDFAFCTYLSDLAVDEKYQKMGIGKELIKLTKLAAPQAKLILLAAPKAVNYYPKIGMDKWEQCYVLDDVSKLK
jgi:ribosomal protein S18 acetylase RimI-like enzyme